ncbi:MAG TPA: DNA polymerase III subunit gamma/tau [Phycisphaerae bacterium]|nr:DNA polymerase III subunit gamma/tau [Phycisphaerae bacterium]HNU43751.1 DNA polymerase III subunit gamma/tau [Phycisphaerae bacterium]
MSYRVLARAYRSNTFDEIVGQDAIAATLRNAIASGRVHHGYLFTGTRGVGKTSMARILAKSLNCLATATPTATPCCKCDVCVATAEGEDVDVVEIDAASNTGVDNIRDLRSNAALRPARARYKIYIIDEVHMLSPGAFNALLKTLEEPPPHVKFILATTEVQKVPATIQSRCQRFDFRAISTSIIAAHLQRILSAEKIEAEDVVLRRIARLANGSMRDALSLLDKVLAYEAKHLTEAVIDELLPPPHDELVCALVDHVARQEPAAALAALDAALQQGQTVERFCDHLIEHLRVLMLLRVCGTETELVDVAGTLRPQLAAQAQRFDAPTYVYLITLAEELRRNAKFSGTARALAEAVIVRMAMSRQFSDISAWIEQLRGASGSAREATAGSAATAPSGSAGRASPTSAPGSRPDSSRGVVAPETPVAAAPARRTGRTASSRASRAGDAAPEPGRPGPGSGGEPEPHGEPSGSSWVPPEDAGLPEEPRTPPPRRSLSTEETQQVLRDPVVQQVLQAVDGTLFDVRRPGGVAPTARTPLAGPASEGRSVPSNTETE